MIIICNYSVFFFMNEMNYLSKAFKEEGNPDFSVIVLIKCKTMITLM